MLQRTGGRSGSGVTTIAQGRSMTTTRKRPYEKTGKPFGHTTIYCDPVRQHINDSNGEVLSTPLNGTVQIRQYEPLATLKSDDSSKRVKVFSEAGGLPLEHEQDIQVVGIAGEDFAHTTHRGSTKIQTIVSGQATIRNNGSKQIRRHDTVFVELPREGDKDGDGRHVLKVVGVKTRKHPYGSEACEDVIRSARDQYPEQKISAQELITVVQTNEGESESLKEYAELLASTDGDLKFQDAHDAFRKVLIEQMKNITQKGFSTTPNREKKKAIAAYLATMTTQMKEDDQKTFDNLGITLFSFLNQLEEIHKRCSTDSDRSLGVALSNAEVGQDFTIKISPGVLSAGGSETV
jgi:hypothetical protein